MHNWLGHFSETYDVSDDIYDDANSHLVNIYSISDTAKFIFTMEFDLQNNYGIGISTPLIDD